MPPKERARYNAYMREYMRKRYHRKRREALNALGGRCVVCGTRRKLEIDHIRPSSKVMSISKIWTYSKVRFWREVRKCQLLCQKHHREKTARDLRKPLAKGTHGTLSAYRWCKPPRCELCRAAMRQWRQRRRARIERAHAT